MFKVNDWVIPTGTKKIVQIEAVEEYDTVVVAYTSDRSAYPIDSLETLKEVHERETNNA